MQVFDASNHRLLEGSAAEAVACKPGLEMERKAQKLLSMTFRAAMMVCNASAADLVPKSPFAIPMQWILMSYNLIIF